MDAIVDGRKDLVAADWPEVERDVLPKARAVADDGQKLLAELDSYPWPTQAAPSIKQFRVQAVNTRAGWSRIANAENVSEVVRELRTSKQASRVDAVRSALGATGPDPLGDTQSEAIQALSEMCP